MIHGGGGGSSKKRPRCNKTSNNSFESNDDNTDDINVVSNQLGNNNNQYNNIDREDDGIDDDDHENDESSEFDTTRSRNNTNTATTTTTTTNAAVIPPNVMLPSYLADAFSELYEEDGLICFGKGLQWLVLLAVFVRYYSDNTSPEGYAATLQEVEKEAEQEYYQEINRRTGINATTTTKSTTTTRGVIIKSPQQQRKQRRRPLVLVLGLRDTERTTLLQILQSWGTPNSMLPTMITNEAGQAKDRIHLYQQSNVICITSRILIVDLLTSTLKPSAVHGILVAHGETVTEQSTEAFIIRIYQSQRQQQQQQHDHFSDYETDATNHHHHSTATSSLSGLVGFVKAFCDTPEQLINGFGQMEKILRSLHVRKLYLYPRFHDSIRNELEIPMNVATPNVIEYTQSLSLLQQEIQQALAASVLKCLRELRKSTEHYMEASHIWKKNSTENQNTTTSTTNDNKSRQQQQPDHTTDTESSSSNYFNHMNEISIENCVTSYFDRAIMKQLEPFWHKLPPATKQLVTDLQTLRTLFHALLQYDCISFYNLLCSIKSLSVSTRYPAMWLLDPLADIIYKKAKERLYMIQYQNHSDPITHSNTGTSNNESNNNNNNNTNIHNNGKRQAVLKPILEMNPKWKLLQQVLNEIRIDFQQKQEQDLKNTGSATTASGTTAVVTVLVMVKDEKTMELIKGHLTEGRNQKQIMLRWLRYLEVYNDRSRTTVSTAAGQQQRRNYYNNNNHTTTTTNHTDILSEESRLLLEEEGRVRRIFLSRTNRCRKKNQYPTQKKQQPQQKMNAIPSYLLQRRRIVSEKNRGMKQYQQGGNANEIHQNNNDILNEAIAVTEHEMRTADVNFGMERNHNDNNDDGGDAHETDENNSNNIDTDTEEEEDYMYHTSLPGFNDNNNHNDDDDSQLRIILRTYTSLEGEQELLYLHELQPQYIVLYDAEVPFIRAVEIYSAVSYRLHTMLHKTNNNDSSTHHKNDQDQYPLHRRITVYFLTFTASAEEKNLKKSLEREQQSFEKLIQQKCTMAPPILYSTGGMNQTQELLHALEQGSVGGTYSNQTLPLAFDTRTNTLACNGGGGTSSTRRGGGNNNNRPPRCEIVVDVREFRSALPNILNLNGMRIAPVTLTVGDYILTNVHCIERKSISDLFGSFNSGRLYTQMETMTKYYQCPCLLIEFDPQKNFSLQNVSEIGNVIRTDSISSKMVLFILHFPKVRLLWSRSPHETYKLFRDLKTNHEEPNVELAIQMGRNELEEETIFLNNNNNNNNDDEDVDERNDIAKEMLLRLPGMNVPAARRIMNEVDTLADLLQLSFEELRRIAGPNVGPKLYHFFKQNL